MNSISISIAILPDEKTAQMAIALSQKLARAIPTKFVLNGKDLIPHFTIYQAEFPVDNVEKLENAVSEIMSNYKSFELKLDLFSATKQGNIWWNVINDSEMKTLQNLVIEKCNPLREGLILPLYKTYKHIDSDQRKEIENYGSLWVVERYHPHISISKIGNEYLSQTLELMGKAESASFTASKIIIGKLGDYGTVTEIIKTFNLAS